jgi:hypothetical protein
MLVAFTSTACVLAPAQGHVDRRQSAVGRCGRRGSSCGFTELLPPRNREFRHRVSRFDAPVRDGDGSLSLVAVVACVDTSNGNIA